MFFITNSFAVAHAAEVTTLVSDGLGLSSANLGGYFNNLFQLALLVGAVLAVLIIASAGLQYMSTDAVSGKGESKTRITQALIGLLMLLSVWLFFNEINPRILDLDFELDGVSTTVTETEAQRQARLEQERKARLAEEARREQERLAEANRRADRARAALAALRNDPNATVGIQISTVVGNMPYQYAVSIPRAADMTAKNCPASVDPLYTSTGSSGSGADCTKNYFMGSNGCCVYKLDTSKLGD